MRHQVEFPKTHDISRLRSLVLNIDSVLSENLESADALTPYGVEFRYPGDFPDITREQAANAFHIATQTKQIVLDYLNQYLDQGRPPDTEK